MRYYAWQVLEEEVGAVTLTVESDYRKFNGDMGPEPTLLYTIDTPTWEEAMAIHHVRQGFEPYKPGPPGECPACKSVLYPEGSGVCWKCGPVVLDKVVCAKHQWKASMGPRCYVCDHE